MDEVLPGPPLAAKAELTACASSDEPTDSAPTCATVHSKEAAPEKDSCSSASGNPACDVAGGGSSEKDGDSKNSILKALLSEELSVVVDTTTTLFETAIGAPRYAAPTTHVHAAKNKAAGLKAAKSSHQQSLAARAGGADAETETFSAHVEQRRRRGCLAGPHALTGNEYDVEVRFPSSANRDRPAKLNQRDFYREIFVSRYVRLRGARPRGGASASPAPEDEQVDVDGGAAPTKAAGRAVVMDDALVAARRLRETRRSRGADASANRQSADGDAEEPCFEVDALLDRVTESPAKRLVASRVLRVVTDTRRAVATYEGHEDELNLRHVSMLKQADRLRAAFSPAIWDAQLAAWVHGMLLAYLPESLLACYVDLLRYLHEKVPSLVDALVASEDRRPGAFDLASFMARNPIDPAAIGTFKIKAVWRRFHFVIVQAAFNMHWEKPVKSATATAQTTFKRNELILRSFRNLIGGNSYSELRLTLSSPLLTPAETVDELLSELRRRVAEIMRSRSDSAVILVGWDTSCLLNLAVAQEAQVAGLINLAFSNLTMIGSRGDVDDDILSTACPTLFVVGQFSATCSIDDLQDLRESIRGDSGLIVVGGADSHLRVSKEKLLLENVTQRTVDRLIQDHIIDFLNYAFTKQGTARMPPRPIVEHKTVQLNKKKEFPGAFPERKAVKDSGASKRKLSQLVDDVASKALCGARPTARGADFDKAAAEARRSSTDIYAGVQSSGASSYSVDSARGVKQETAPLYSRHHPIAMRYGADGQGAAMEQWARVVGQQTPQVRQVVRAPRPPPFRSYGYGDVPRAPPPQPADGAAARTADNVAQRLSGGEEAAATWRSPPTLHPPAPPPFHLARAPRINSSRLQSTGIAAPRAFAGR